MGFVRRHPFLAAAAVLVLSALVVVAATAVAVWRAAHTDEASRIDHADAVAVLGAAEYGGLPSPVFRGRLEHAALLYRRDFTDRVIVLGAGRAGDRTTEAEAGREWLVADGLPSDSVFADPVGNTTLESLYGLARFMRTHGLSSVFLVSDPWHNLRIRRMARDLGVRGYVSATWHSAAKSQWTRLAGYARETFAYLAYRVLHR